MSFNYSTSMTVDAHYKFVRKGIHVADNGEIDDTIVVMEVPVYESGAGLIVSNLRTGCRSNWTYDDYRMRAFFNQVACQRHFEIPPASPGV